MASLYAKFTFIYRKTKVIFRLEDVKYLSVHKSHHSNVSIVDVYHAS